MSQATSGTAPKKEDETPPKKDDETPASDAGRWKYGLVAVVAGLLATLISFFIAVVFYQDATSVTNSAAAVAAVLAPITTVIGTMVGAYFGLQAGSQGAAKAQDQAAEAQKEAVQQVSAAKDQSIQLASVSTNPVATAEIVGLDRRQVEEAMAQAPSPAPQPQPTTRPGP